MQVWARNWNWNQEKKQLNFYQKIIKKIKVYHLKESQSMKIDTPSTIYGRQEVIYNTHTKYESHQKINSTDKEVLKLGFK